MVFNVYHFDFEAGTRTSPLGRVEKLASLSFFTPPHSLTLILALRG